jgi:hypothetical protein
MALLEVVLAVLNEPWLETPDVIFEALRFGMLAVASTPPRFEAAPNVAIAAKPLTAATPTEFAGRLIAPVARKDSATSRAYAGLAVPTPTKLEFTKIAAAPTPL